MRANSNVNIHSASPQKSKSKAARSLGLGRTVPAEMCRGHDDVKHVVQQLSPRSFKQNILRLLTIGVQTQVPFTSVNAPVYAKDATYAFNPSKHQQLLG